MLTEIRLKNARNFKGKTYKFPLGQLNAVTGENSSGKSTILKSLLLLRQSIRFNPNAIENPMLRFGGPLVDLGDFQTFIGDNKVENSLELGLTFEGIFPESLFKRKKDLTLKSIRFFNFIEKSSNTKNEIPYKFNVDFTFNHSEFFSRGLSPHRARELRLISSGPGKGVLTSTRFSIYVKSKKIFECKIDLAKKSFNNSDFIFSIPKFFGELYFNKVDLPKFFEETGCYQFGTSFHQFMPFLLEKSKATGGKGRYRGLLVPPILRITSMGMYSDLEKIKYLGPLRSQGQRFYILDPDPISGDDPIGQYLPNILRDNAKRKVIYCSPNDWSLEKSGTLQKALNEWLKYLKGGRSRVSKYKSEFTTDYFKQVLSQISLRGADGKPHSLLDSGFGFSQVLPILVDILRAPRDSIFIVEQPELHLHPAIQVRLAEFFVAMSGLGKRIIFETHSEHMINAIRALVAEKKGDFSKGEIKIYYISTYRKVPKIFDLGLTSKGDLGKWPKGFFGETAKLSVRILKAQSKN